MSNFFAGTMKVVILIASLSQVANADLVVSDNLLTFDWQANCYDCQSEQGIEAPLEQQVLVTGDIILRDYTIGEDVTGANIVSFGYFGPSTHINPFRVDGSDITNVTGRINLDGTYDAHFMFQSELVFNGYNQFGEVVGQITQLVDVAVNYYDTGDWSYIINLVGCTDEQCVTQPDDFGNGAKITNGINVPEPSTLAIFALGLMGLASRRFKKQS